MLKKINILVVIVSLLFLIGCDKEEAKSAKMNPNFHNLSKEMQDQLRSEVDDSDLDNEESNTTIVSSSNQGNSQIVASSELGENVKQRSDGGVEIEGVPVSIQGQADPFGNGGPGWRPGGYCGPTALQMVLAYHGVEKSRDELAFTHPDSGNLVGKTLNDNGQMYVANMGGTVHGRTPGVAKQFGLSNSKQLIFGSKSEGIGKLKDLISQGRPQIVNIQGAINYTDGYSRVTKGHVIVVKGFTGSGDVIVNDPAVGSKIMTKESFNNIWRPNTVDVSA